LECVRRDRPDARTRARYWNAGQPLLATKILIAINVGASERYVHTISLNLSAISAYSTTSIKK
jgi:hypothetical protein